MSAPEPGGGGQAAGGVRRRHVVVGAGTAGFNAVTTLLSLDPRADVTLVAAEVPYARMVLPYYLSSEIDEANVYTISPARLEQLGVKLRLGRRASGLDRAAKRLLLDDGESLPYDDLLIASGSSAVRPPLPGIDGAGVYDHWTLVDTQALRRRVRPGAEVALVGAGFIAFTLVNPLLHAGCRLTLIEREPRVLPRMLNATAASVLEAWLAARDVRLLTGMDLRQIEDAAAAGRKRLTAAPRVDLARSPSAAVAAAGGTVPVSGSGLVSGSGASGTGPANGSGSVSGGSGASGTRPVNGSMAASGSGPVSGSGPASGGMAASGSGPVSGGLAADTLAASGGSEQVIEADVVIVATGIRQNLGWLADSGLTIEHGLVVDEQLRTNDGSIYAAGDVAEVSDAVSGERAVMAIETAAMEQGRIVGAAMAGQPRTYAGGLLMNVIEAAGLQAASFGQWAGGEASEGRAAGGHYRRYVWAGDRLIGGVLIGPARQVASENDMGMLKGLVQAGLPLGQWKRLLVERPFELKKVYLAVRAAGALLPRTVLGRPTQPLAEALAAAGA